MSEIATERADIRDPQQRAVPYYIQYKIKPWHAAFYGHPSKKRLLEPLKLSANSHLVSESSSSLPKLKNFHMQSFQSTSTQEYAMLNSKEQLKNIYIKPKNTKLNIRANYKEHVFSRKNTNNYKIDYSNDTIIDGHSFSQVFHLDSHFLFSSVSGNKAQLSQLWIQDHESYTDLEIQLEDSIVPECGLSRSGEIYTLSLSTRSGNVYLFDFAERTPFTGTLEDYLTNTRILHISEGVSCHCMSDNLMCFGLDTGSFVMHNSETVFQVEPPTSILKNLMSYIKRAEDHTILRISIVYDYIIMLSANGNLRMYDIFNNSYVNELSYLLGNSYVHWAYNNNRVAIGTGQKVYLISVLGNRLEEICQINISDKLISLDLNERGLWVKTPKNLDFYEFNGKQFKVFTWETEALEHDLFDCSYSQIKERLLVPSRFPQQILRRAMQESLEIDKEQIKEVLDLLSPEDLITVLDRAKNIFLADYKIEDICCCKDIDGLLPFTIRNYGYTGTIREIGSEIERTSLQVSYNISHKKRTNNCFSKLLGSIRAWRASFEADLNYYMNISIERGSLFLMCQACSIDIPQRLAKHAKLQVSKIEELIRREHWETKKGAKLSSFIVFAVEIGCSTFIRSLADYTIDIWAILTLTFRKNMADSPLLARINTIVKDLYFLKTAFQTPLERRVEVKYSDSFSLSALICLKLSNQSLKSTQKLPFKGWIATLSDFVLDSILPIPREIIEFLQENGFSYLVDAFYPEFKHSMEIKQQFEVRDLIEKKHYALAILRDSSCYKEVVNHAFQNRSFHIIVEAILPYSIRTEILEILIENTKSQDSSSLMYQVSSMQSYFTWGHALYAFSIYHGITDVACTAIYQVYELSKSIVESPSLSSEIKDIFRFIQREALLLCQNLLAATPDLNKFFDSFGSKRKMITLSEIRSLNKAQK